MSYGLQLDKSCLVMSCQIKQTVLALPLPHIFNHKTGWMSSAGFLWGFGWGGGSDCWGSLSCNLPVFSLENGLFYMFYSLLKHTISTHFRQFEMQKRSEPHLNCFDDLFGEKETASYFRNYFQLLFNFLPWLISSAGGLGGKIWNLGTKSKAKKCIST